MKQWAHEYENGKKGHIHETPEGVFVVAIEGAGGIRTAQSIEKAVELANQIAAEAASLNEWKTSEI